jgi:RNA polymerase sigma factor (sigma-70 family)
MSNDGSPPSDSPGPRDERPDPEPILYLIERARAGDRRSSACSPATSGRFSVGSADGYRTGPAIWPTPTTLSRTRCFRRSRGSGTSSLDAFGALQAYLRQAVLNRLRDEVRRKGRQPEIGDLEGVELESVQSPLEQAIGREAVDRYERALERLKPEEREAIIARVEMGYSYEELAQVLGKPTADAARKAAQRALVHLAEEMKGAGE